VLRCVNLLTKNIHLPFNSNLTSLKQGIEDDRGQGVDTQQWKHILTLLSVAVVVDNRVYKEEVDMFVERALSLKDTYLSAWGIAFS